MQNKKTDGVDLSILKHQKPWHPEEKPRQWPKRDTSLEELDAHPDSEDLRRSKADEESDAYDEECVREIEMRKLGEEVIFLVEEDK